MATITININRDTVYDEVAKATDYTGAKMLDGDDKARDRIFTTDEDLETLSRFWDEAETACNEQLKSMLISGTTTAAGVYTATLEVSKSFDQNLTASVSTALKSFFIKTIVGQWFKFANKGEAADYFEQASEFMQGAMRLLYSRKRPSIPQD